MAKIQRFEDVRAWQMARRLTVGIYAACRLEPFSHDFGFKDQITRAVVSISSNIAEGFERGSDKDFVRFLYIAKGSAGEVRSLLYGALDLGYLPMETFNRLLSEVVDISNALSKFIGYLEQSETSPSKS